MVDSGVRRRRYPAQFAGVGGRKRSLCRAHSPVTHHRERRAEIGEDHSKILVLSTGEETREDALQRRGTRLCCFEATMAGLATCTLPHHGGGGQPRYRRRLIGEDEISQVLIRVGMTPARGEVPPATCGGRSTRVLQIRQRGPRQPCGTLPLRRGRHRGTDTIHRFRAHDALSILTAVDRRRHRRLEQRSAPPQAVDAR